MSEVEQPTNGDPGFRITSGVLYTKLEGVEKELAALRIENALLNHSVSALVTSMGTQQTRVEKLEGRFNSILVGLGVGIVTALVAVFRGVIA